MKGSPSMALEALPPGPKGKYLTGNLLDYARDPLSFLTLCSREYGDVVRLRFPGLRLYLLYHPDHAEYVLVKNNRSFKKSRYFRRELGFLGKGLLNNEGEFWRRQRRLAQPAFHRQRINLYGEVMVSYTEQMLATWQNGETRDVHQEMMRLLLDIVAKVLFDAEIAEGGEVRKALDQAVKRFDEQGSGMLLRFLLGNFPTPTNLRFRRAVGRLDEVIYRLINERRRSGKDTGDLLSMLLHAQDEECNKMSNKQLRDEVLTLLLAGHETNALALSWSWYLLSEHPQVESKLLEELQEVLSDRTPTVEDLPRLRYTEMVIKESLRLYPPAWGISREAIKRCEIEGYLIPAGTQLFIPLWVLHRDPRFFEDAEVFNPDRWEDGLAKRVPKYAYLPFGAGPRLCIGSSFAMTEATLLLATIAKKFRLELATGQQRVVLQPSVTLRPRGGIRMVLKERSANTSQMVTRS